jgi:hypothetical protein
LKVLNQAKKDILEKKHTSRIIEGNNGKEIVPVKMVLAQEGQKPNVPKQDSRKS